MDIPDGFKDLLTRECVIVIPSVLKLAFGVGADFGPRRHHLPQSPALHRTLERTRALRPRRRKNMGFQLGGEATDFVLLVMNQRRQLHLRQQSEARCRRLSRCRPQGTHPPRATRTRHAAEVLTIPARVDCLPHFGSKLDAFRSDGTHKKLSPRPQPKRLSVKQSRRPCLPDENL